jgi:hypothetical protein
MGIIYRITCKTTGKHYIGATILSLEDRWHLHIRDCGKDLKSFRQRYPCVENEKILRAILIRNQNDSFLLFLETPTRMKQQSTPKHKHKLMPKKKFSCTKRSLEYAIRFAKTISKDESLPIVNDIKDVSTGRKRTSLNDFDDSHSDKIRKPK